jgi:hypothetical protein
MQRASVSSPEIPIFDSLYLPLGAVKCPCLSGTFRDRTPYPLSPIPHPPSPILYALYGCLLLARR